MLLTKDPEQLVFADTEMMGDVLANQLSSKVSLFGMVSSMVSHFNSSWVSDRNDSLLPNEGSSTVLSLTATATMLGST